MNKKLRYTALTTLTLAGTLLLTKSLDVRLKTHYKQIKHTSIQSEVRIAFLSDLHGNTYGKGYKHLLQPLKQARPDIILLGGDIFDCTRHHANSWNFLMQLSKLYAKRIYMVKGNHEVAKGFNHLEMRMLEKLGIQLVGNKTVNILINQQHLVLTGLDDREDWYHTLSDLHRNHNNNAQAYHILLAHRPSHIKEYLQGNYNLILAGHTHGGQVRIPYLLNGLYTTDQGWLPKYAGGWYDFEDEQNRNHTQLLVGRGLTYIPRKSPRIFNPTELHIIDLEPSTK